MGALTFDDIPVSSGQKSGALSFDDLPMAKSGGLMQSVGNLAAGAIRGAGSIGATIVAPYDIAKDAIAGKGLSLESNRQRRKDMDEALQSLGADPESMAYGAGKFVTEVAGTMGAPGVLAKGAQAAGAAPKVVNAIQSGGFSLGTPAAGTVSGAARDVATRLAGGAAAGAAAAGLANPDDATSGAMVGAAIPAAVKAAGTVGMGIKGAAKQALGATTGTSAEAVSAAFNAGKSGSKEFIDNMRGNASFDDVVATAKEGLGKMREARAAQYRSGMVDISNDKTILDFTPIEDAMKRVISIGNYKGVQTNKNASGIVDELNSAISEWKSLSPADFHTPEGIDALKRKVGDIRDATQFGTPARRAADAVYNAVKNQISSQAPTYAKVMKDYAEASATMDEITRALSLGEGTAKDTAIRKLQSLMRNNAQTNYGNRLSLADELEQRGGVSIAPSIAGQAMNSWMPRGMSGAIQKAGIPFAGAAGFAAASAPGAASALAALPLASPRLVGEAAYMLGKASGKAGGVADRAAALPSQEAKTLIENAIRIAPILGLSSQEVRR